MIPGINVLGIAFGAIAQQTVQHIAFVSRTQNAVGAWVTNYAAPVSVRASWQPVDSKKYEQLGLDMAKEYHNIWLKSPVTGIKRGKSPDRFVGPDNRLHEVADVPGAWHSQDGWSEVMVIDIGPYVAPVTP